MRVEVDQSGKIGDTRVPTVLAFSDGNTYAIMIPAKVKRKCVHRLRRRGEAGTTLYLKLFAVGLYLLLKDHISKMDCATIDVEYPGHDIDIRLYLLNMLQRAGIATDAGQIQFQHIGKRSRAHELALAVFTKIKMPDRTIELGEILAEF